MLIVWRFQLLLPFAIRSLHRMQREHDIVIIARNDRVLLEDWAVISSWCRALLEDWAV